MYHSLLLLKGGKRCTVADCGHGAVGPSGKCRAHGGGQRCKADGCNKAATHNGSTGNNNSGSTSGGGGWCAFHSAAQAVTVSSSGNHSCGSNYVGTNSIGSSSSTSSSSGSSDSVAGSNAGGISIGSGSGLIGNVGDTGISGDFDNGIGINFCGNDVFSSSVGNTLADAISSGFSSDINNGGGNSGPIDSLCNGNNSGSSASAGIGENSGGISGNIGDSAIFSSSSSSSDSSSNSTSVIIRSSGCPTSDNTSSSSSGIVGSSNDDIAHNSSDITGAGGGNNNCYANAEVEVTGSNQVTGQSHAPSIEAPFLPLEQEGGIVSAQI